MFITALTHLACDCVFVYVYVYYCTNSSCMCLCVYYCTNSSCTTHLARPRGERKTSIVSMTKDREKFEYILLILAFKSIRIEVQDEVPEIQVTRCRRIVSTQFFPPSEYYVCVGIYVCIFVCIYVYNISHTSLSRFRGVLKIYFFSFYDAITWKKN